MSFLDDIAHSTSNQQIINAMAGLDRRVFVPELMQHHADKNSPLPIACEQTISQPTIVAMMTDLLMAYQPRKVLEIGTGSGYQAAILARLVDEVYSVERHLLLHQQAAAVLRKLGYANITLKHGDGSQGFAEHAPFDAIIVTAAADEIPQILLAQLKIGGVMVIPVNEGDAQHDGGQWQYLKKIVKDSETDYNSEDCSKVRFVPLIKDNNPS